MGVRNAEYITTWNIWPSSATDMPSDAYGKLCANDAKESQDICGEDGDIYALDRACGGTRSKPLPNVLPKFLSGQSRSVHAEQTPRRWTIEKPHQNLDVGRVVCGVHCLKVTPPLYVRRDQEIRPEREISTYLVLKVDVQVLSQATVTIITPAAYSLNQRHSSISSRRQDTNALTED